MPAWCKRLLFPGGKWIVLSDILGAAGLYLAFGTWLGETPFAYFAYLLSAYALVISAAWIIGRFRPAMQQLLHSVALIHRYLTDGYFKVRISMLLSFAINLAYACFKLICAVLYISFWDGALALYNILLCAVRLYLLRRVPTGPNQESRDRELRQYRVTGGFLLTLDAALGIIAVQIVQHGQSYHYPGTLIYVVALYAFYSLSLGIANMIKYRTFNSPVLSAAKAVNLTAALVSIFNLETAMLAAFGEGYQHQKLMTAATAGTVWLLVFCMAVYMVLNSQKELKEQCKQRRRSNDSYSGIGR